jgi:hypothetical protein
MILLSLNIRGVGGPLKFPSMRRLLSKTNLDIIFLQETLVVEDKARHFMNVLCPNWMICAVNSVGKSGGLWCHGTQTIFVFKSFPKLWWHFIDRLSFI